MPGGTPSKRLDFPRRPLSGNPVNRGKRDASDDLLFSRCKLLITKRDFRGSYEILLLLPTTRVQFLPTAVVSTLGKDVLSCNILAIVGFVKNSSKVGISFLLAHACSGLANLTFKHLRHKSHILALCRLPCFLLLAV